MNDYKMDRYMGGKATSKLLGVHQRTLYNWEKAGHIETIRTPNGKRLYNISKYMKIYRLDEAQTDKLKICYVRVSSNGQRNDLERQIRYMRHKYPTYMIIEDIGSGINMNRRGLNRIIDLAIEGKILELVVAHKDRLSRFGYSFVERILRKYSDASIVVINSMVKKSVYEELVEDVLQVMNVFVAKMNGLRKYKL